MRNKAMGDFFGYVMLVAGCGMLLFATGCSGVELGGRVGLYRVDERQESQRTYRHSVPWKCYFTQCDAATLGTEEREGS